MKEESRKQHPFSEAGRRLKAAMISYQMRYKGVDSTLKTTTVQDGDGWAELAEQLARHGAEQISRQAMGHQAVEQTKKETVN
ncbi:MAG: hypothetical protein V4734_06970 [Terriglobus sp.]